MQIDTHIVNAFTANGSGGNGAGVVLAADHLSDINMQLVAQQLGFSETAFVLDSPRATFKLRFFTITEEVNLCGHATIAAWSLLYQKGLIQPGSYTQETLAGVLAIEVDANGLVFMRQTEPEFLANVNLEELSGSLNIPTESFDTKFLPQIISTGLEDIICGLKNEDDLRALKPDFSAITRLSNKYDVIGIHVFTLTSGSDTIATVRNFAPRVGIYEEPATGTSNGALLCYLKHQGQLPEAEIYRIEQGASMGKLSFIFGKFLDNHIWIGGNATLTNTVRVKL